MRLLDMLLCLLCVALGSAGQVLLRAASLKASQMQGQGLAAWMHGTTVLALVLYGGGMLLWLWVLSRVPITQAFAFFGLSFIAVPLLAHHWLGDPLTPQMLLGGVVILAGIALTHWPAS
jgi:undecaprenyl phosphate-alpha-L-ara4N flippase subunit ArnE